MTEPDPTLPIPTADAPASEPRAPSPAPPSAQAPSAARARSILTDEHVGAARARRIVLLVLGALVTLVAVNFGAGYWLRRNPRNIGYYLVSAKWQLLQQQREPVDWLFLGDSSCNQGVRPDVIVSERAESALNLCTIGDMLTINDAWMLDRYLAEVGKPRRVVVVHVYDLWPRPAHRLRRGLAAVVPLEWGYWADLEPPLKVSSNDIERLLLTRYLPLYAENLTLAGWILHPDQLLETRVILDPTGYMRVDQARPDAVALSVASHLEAVRGRRPGVSLPNREGMATIASLAAKHSLPVYVAMAPLADSLWSDEPFRAHHGQVVAGIRRLVRGSTIRVALAEPPTYAAEQMDEADHLTHEPAADYTRRLAEEVMKLESEGAGRGKPPKARRIER